jgi:hypothetical protein
MSKRVKGSAPKDDSPPQPKGGKPSDPVQACGAHVIGAEEWQKEKCRMLADLKRHMRGPSSLFDVKHMIVDSAFPGYVAASKFDSNYGTTGAQNQFTFYKGGPMPDAVLYGHEVNYYFQGMIAAAYKMSRTDLDQIVSFWKTKVRPEHLPPSAATIEMSRLGYDSYEQDQADCARRNKPQ